MNLTMTVLQSLFVYGDIKKQSRNIFYICGCGKGDDCIMNKSI